MNVNDLIGKRVILTKMESINYKEGHPNGIEPGYTRTGVLVLCEVGYPVEITDGRFILDYFHTSVVERIEDGMIYTKNSVYKIEELEEV